MSQIVDFFVHGNEDNKGRTFDSMLAKSDYYLEASHDFIQWLFPLHEKSLHSVGTPVLTKEDVETLSTSVPAKDRMLDALARFRDFYGIEPRNQKKIDFWCNDGNHNLLRVTRIIRSLRLFGLEDKARQFFNEVLDIGHERRINKTTRMFWDKAMNEDVWESLTHDFLKMKRIEVT